MKQGITTSKPQKTPKFSPKIIKTANKNAEKIKTKTFRKIYSRFFG